MKIVVFGANGPTGRQVTKQALAKGHTVTAVTRHPELFPFRDARLQVMRGNVFNLASVEQAVYGQDAVLSSLGVPFSRKPITVYSEGIANIEKAMKSFGVRRLVCVSSSATEPQYDPEGGFFFEKIIQPTIIRTIGRTLYDDMRRMEKLVMNSDLDWTIIRPSGLFETPEVTPYQMAESHIKGRFTSRTDLADSMLQQLTDDSYLRKFAAVVTVATQPNLLKLILKEAFQSRPK
jgi:putative NADH-flavin reductase